jgi:hypothetical protein
VPRRRVPRYLGHLSQDAVGLANLKTFLRKAPNGVVVAELGLLLLGCSHKGAVGVEESTVISGASSESVCSDTNDQDIYDTSDIISADVQLVRLCNGSTSTLYLPVKLLLMYAMK